MHTFLYFAIPHFLYFTSLFGEGLDLCAHFFTLLSLYYASFEIVSSTPKKREAPWGAILGLLKLQRMSIPSTPGKPLFFSPLKPLKPLQPLISNKLAPIPNCVIVVFVIQLTFVPFCHQPFCICTGLIKKPLSHFNLLISTTLHLFVVILSTRCVLNNSFSLVIVFIKKKKIVNRVVFFLHPKTHSLIFVFLSGKSFVTASLSWSLCVQWFISLPKQ